MKSFLLLAAALSMLQSPVRPMRSIEKGTRSGIASARQTVVRDETAWASLWRDHASAQPRPSVDFSREMVVGVFLGTRPTAGFEVEIVGYRDEGARVVVQYRETMPPPGTIAAQVIVTPYHIAAMPQRPAPITFEKLP